MTDAPIHAEPPPLRSPAALRNRVSRLLGVREEKQKHADQVARELAEQDAFLEIADEITGALEALSEQLFQKVLDLVQTKLTIALQEVLEQPVELQATADFKRSKAAVSFSIRRDGHEEDIMKGQGGSVANVLSVGLRMFALATLDPQKHRPFLVLDEQDCWLRPELVPRLVKIIAEAARALGLQVLMISHHDLERFDRYAERIYRFVPEKDGVVRVERAHAAPGEPDDA